MTEIRRDTYGDRSAGGEPERKTLEQSTGPTVERDRAFAHLLIYLRNVSWRNFLSEQINPSAITSLCASDQFPGPEPMTRIREVATQYHRGQSGGATESFVRAIDEIPYQILAWQKRLLTVSAGPVITENFVPDENAKTELARRAHEPEDAWQQRISAYMDQSVEEALRRIAKPAVSLAEAGALLVKGLRDETTVAQALSLINELFKEELSLDDAVELVTRYPTPVQLLVSEFASDLRTLRA